MKRLLILTFLTFTGLVAYSQGTQVGDTNSPIYHYNGNVGIGTTNPDVKLDIIGNIQLSNSGDRKIGFGDFDGKLYYGLGLFGNDVRIVGYNSDNRHIAFGFNDQYENWTPSITIDNNGRVGVGVTDPDVKLDVFGNIQLSNSGDRKIGFGDFDGKLYYGLGLFGNDVRIVGFNSNNRHIAFGFNDQYENWISSMTIENTGKVGIGTTDFSGNHKLRVEGTIGAKKVKVTSTGWPDFVFESDYNLPTLKEVENFIGQYGHLPDIPSADEVKVDGISLGEMDSKLLQKIEELTLYVIDLKKENELMKTRINQLENDK